jgi:hypothetical protein
MRRTTKPSLEILNKDLNKTLACISFWFKPFSLDLKPFETLFKRPKKLKIHFFVLLAFFMSFIVCIGWNIWIRKHEFSKPKIAEFITVISE